MAYDFDKIARDYDRMNRLMSFRLDTLWRKRAIKELAMSRSPLSALDVACGTGDMIKELQKHGANVTGVDLSEEMMIIARKKCPSAHIQAGNAEHLPFEDNTFDVVTCAFGVRNFVHLEAGLKEMMRVLKTGGRMAILELATPDSVLIRPFYNLYTKKIIPWLGNCIAGNRGAYTYLPESITRFSKGLAMVEKLKASGAAEVKHKKLTFGVCRLYSMVK